VLHRYQILTNCKNPKTSQIFTNFKTAHPKLLILSHLRLRWLHLALSLSLSLSDLVEASSKSNNILSWINGISDGRPSDGPWMDRVRFSRFPLSSNYSNASEGNASRPQQKQHRHYSRPDKQPVRLLSHAHRHTHIAHILIKVMFHPDTKIANFSYVLPSHGTEETTLTQQNETHTSKPKKIL